MPAFGSEAPRTPTATLPLTKQLGTGAESAYELYLGCSRHVRPLPFAALPAMSLPHSLHCYGATCGRRLRLWETAKAGTTLRNAQGAGKRLSASRSPRKRRRGNNAVATSVSYCPSTSRLSLHFPFIVDLTMRMKKAGKQGKQLRKTEAEWEWFKKYRVWDADRKIFLYPENWIEPELRLPARFRESLGEVAAFICGKCGLGTKRERTRGPARRKGVCVLFTGKNRIGALIAAQTVACDLGQDLYRVDLGAVVSIYIGETEKNLRRVFDAAKRSGAVLFFDEADALFGKRTEVHDSHDRYANVEINYFLQRIEEYAGLAILATGNRTKIDNAFSRRFDFLIRIPPRRKSRRKESSARPVMKRRSAAVACAAACVLKLILPSSGLITVIAIAAASTLELRCARKHACGRSNFAWSKA